MSERILQHERFDNECNEDAAIIQWKNNDSQGKSFFIEVTCPWGSFIPVTPAVTSYNKA